MTLHSVPMQRRENPRQAAAFDAAIGLWSSAHLALPLGDILANVAERYSHQISGVLYFGYKHHETLEVNSRQVRPLSVRWGTSDFYKQPGFLMLAYDLDRRAEREFSIPLMTPCFYDIWHQPVNGEPSLLRSFVSEEEAKEWAHMWWVDDPAPDKGAYYKLVTKRAAWADDLHKAAAGPHG